MRERWGQSGGVLECGMREGARWRGGVETRWCVGKISQLLLFFLVSLFTLPSLSQVDFQNPSNDRAREWGHRGVEWTKFPSLVCPKTARKRAPKNHPEQFSVKFRNLKNGQVLELLRHSKSSCLFQLANKIHLENFQLVNDHQVEYFQEIFLNHF